MSRAGDGRQMPTSPSKRNKSQIGWARRYRARMNKGQEACRKCGVTTQLTFGHLIPRADGGAFTLTNITILCVYCNALQAAERWPELTSLAVEQRRKRTRK